MFARGLEPRELDVGGRGSSSSYRAMDCSPKTSRTLERVGYDLGGKTQSLRLIWPVLIVVLAVGGGEECVKHIRLSAEPGPYNR